MEDRSFLSIFTCAHGEHVWAPSTSAQNWAHLSLDGVSLSDLIWTYVVAGAYCLVQGRVWRFHQRNKDRLDPLSTTIRTRVVDGKRTVERNMMCYTLRGVMEICRFSTQPRRIFGLWNWYRICAQFCVYLFEVTNKKDRLDPLSRGLQIETPSWIQTMVSWKSLATVTIPKPKPF